MDDFMLLLEDAQMHGPAAVRTLVRLLDAGDDKTRLRAAEVLAKLAIEAGELAHLAERIERLEQNAASTV